MARLWISQTRSLSAASGAVALLALGFLPEGSLADRLAQVAFVGLAFAVVLGWLQLSAGVVTRPPSRDRRARHSSQGWLFVIIGVALTAGVVIQSWFRPGMAIGLGDTVLPSGTAWIGRLSEPWTWSGFSMGEPSQLPLALPWAAVLAVVHTLGGDPYLAQRIWYTSLFVSAALSALGLIASLRMGPLAGLVGATFYVLNPYVAGQVNINPVFLAALCPLVAIPAAVIAAGTGRLRVRWSAALCAATAPLIGYVFLNPPLVGMIVGIAIGTPLFVLWIEGRTAALRSLRAIGLAGVLFIPLSAYWIVPAAIHLSSITGIQFASVTSWSFTEVRATLRNAFWLNTVWGWRFPEFYPFAGAYEQPPISLLRFLLPAVAFATVAIGTDAKREWQRQWRERELRLAVAAASIALFVILLSTGTNWPGSIIFDPLYKLPYGWLLREPGRFLMLAAAAYSILIALGVEIVSNRQSVSGILSWRPRWPTSLHIPVAVAILAGILLVGLPVSTGAEIPDSRPGLPAGHVAMPEYWTRMAAYVDAMPVDGSVLVLPPDDFYGMPYSWGYYGADSFIPDLFRRHVLVPNPQGYNYVATPPELTQAVNLTAQSILRHDWPQVAAMAGALNSPLILVRRDVVSPFARRAIMRPVDLTNALERSPNFVFVQRFGLLDLFELSHPLKDPDIGTSYVTINNQSPDLRLLSVLPTDTALVSHPEMAGVPNIVQAPPVESWPSKGNVWTWAPQIVPGSSYSLVDIDSHGVIPLTQAGTSTLSSSGARVSYQPTAGNAGVEVSISGRKAISNGDFASGLWGPVGDCAAFEPTRASPGLRSELIANQAPGGQTALRLSASYDSACVNHSIDWTGKPLILTLSVMNVTGQSPRICMWEFGPQRCASMTPVSSFSENTGITLPYSTGWSTYTTSVIPDALSSALSLYLYADSNGSGDETIIEYANVQVAEVPGLPAVALLANLTSQTTPSAQLEVIHSGYSPQWQGSNGSQHVLVDGLLNGWLIQPGASPVTVWYRPADIFRAAWWISGMVVLIAVLAEIGIQIRSRVRRRRSS
jgi:hypothetical protein